MLMRRNILDAGCQRLYSRALQTDQHPWRRCRRVLWVNPNGMLVCVVDVSWTAWLCLQCCFHCSFLAESSPWVILYSHDFCRRVWGDELKSMQKCTVATFPPCPLLLLPLLTKFGGLWEGDCLLNFSHTFEEEGSRLKFRRDKKTCTPSPHPFFFLHSFHPTHQNPHSYLSTMAIK